MPSRFFAQFSLKTVIVCALFGVGLLPLVFNIVFNLPVVSSKIQQLTELERVHSLEGQVSHLEKTIEHRKANLRTITVLPGAVELFSDPAARFLDPKNIKKRMGAMYKRWLATDTGVQAIIMVNDDGDVVGNWGLNDKGVLAQRPLTELPKSDHLSGWLAEGKTYPVGKVFVVDVDQDFFDKKEEHSHFPRLTLGIGGKNKKGAFGGAIFMEISMAPFVENLPYEFIVSGGGKVLHRNQPPHHNGDSGTHVHKYIPVSEEFPAFLTIPMDKSNLILTSRQGVKTAFLKIVDDPHPQHTVWLAHAIGAGDLENWLTKFRIRFIIILVFLSALVFALAIAFASKADKMRKELVFGLTRLIQEKEPMVLGWKWPVEVKELGLDLETLSQALIESDQSLRQNERFLKGILDGIQDGISVHDQDYNILETNLCMENWFTRKMPLVGKKCYQVFHDRQSPCDFCPTRNALEHGVLQRSILPGEEFADGKKWLEVFAYPVCNEKGENTQVVEFIRDITGIKAAEAERDDLADQLAFAQKMEAVGTLAGGVAHDFNNILSAINGYAEMCLMQMEEDNPFRAKIKTIFDSGQRASGLTQQLLAFSRKQIIRPQDIDVNQSLQGVKRMLTRILGEDIDINIAIRPDLWHVHADQTHFEQVIVNLAVNARDAMPRGGKLTFEAKNVTLDESYVERHYEIAKGEYVLIAVSDSGVGMGKEIMAKIFEPFFTTKEKGKGTGLGLATVYGIIKQNNGEILVYSEPGQGTTFKIYLPRYKPVQAVPQKASDESLAMVMGTETILLVEDDEVVRTMAVEILTTQGYSVLEAADGEEALQTCKRYHGNIDLLLTDVVMPKMNGSELAEKVVKLRPDIKVLFMSGYTDDAVFRHGILHAEVEFLQKPVTPKALSQTLRAILDNSSV